jgi:uncharacterized membrane protein YjfL (UPF0719 family)
VRDLTLSAALATAGALLGVALTVWVDPDAVNMAVGLGLIAVVLWGTLLVALLRGD